MNKKSHTVELNTRVQPTQKRAADSVEKILTAAARMLEEEGLEALNTNYLAEYADVRVRTVYRYFPNKFAVLAELAHRTTEQALSIIDGFAPLADRSVPLREALDLLWLEYLGRMAVLPAFSQIRQATRIYPELQPVRMSLQNVFAEEMMKALKKRGLKLKPAKARAVSTLFIEATSAVMEFTDFQSASRQQDLLTELRSMQYLYLASILDDNDSTA